LPPGPRDPASLLRPDGTLAGDLTWCDEQSWVVRDTDADGLLDVEEDQLGTDKMNRDTDGDALLDGWEVKGVDGTRLQDLGAKPRRIDVFVEMDYMERSDAANGLQPSPAVLANITASFAAAPRSRANHDGSTGIALHLDLNEKVDHDPELDAAGFVDYKKRHFGIARARCFHYMIWIDAWAVLTLDGRRISGQSMDIPYSDFVVALGPWNGGNGGDDAQKTGTFLHELGHNLGLYHGDEERNENANHLSVMSYKWQMTGLKKDGAFGHWTYQWLPLPYLDEESLDEAAGLGGGSGLSGWETAWYGPSGVPRMAAAAGSIDWNGNTITDAEAKVDLNKDQAFSLLPNTPFEWDQLQFDGGTVGDGLPPDALREKALLVPEHLPPETLTEERATAIRKELRYR
jgi:hypothetical protein